MLLNKTIIIVYVVLCFYQAKPIQVIPNLLLQLGLEMNEILIICSSMKLSHWNIKEGIVHALSLYYNLFT